MPSIELYQITDVSHLTAKAAGYDVSVLLRGVGRASEFTIVTTDARYAARLADAINSAIADPAERVA